jgi:hypothetical protein
MNTPRSKPPRRHGQLPKGKQWPAAPDGHYESSLFKAEAHAMRLGQLVAYWTWVEEQFIEFLGVLLGDRQLPSRQIFRAIRGERARIEVLTALLEHARQNKDKGAEYDRVIADFDRLNRRRNAYVHGMWMVHDTGRVFLARRGEALPPPKPATGRPTSPPASDRQRACALRMAPMRHSLLSPSELSCADSRLNARFQSWMPKRSCHSAIAA